MIWYAIAGLMLVQVYAIHSGMEFNFRVGNSLALAALTIIVYPLLYWTPAVAAGWLAAHAMGYLS